MSRPGGGNEDKGKGIAGPNEESLASNLGVQHDTATDAEDDATSEAPTTIDFLSVLEESLSKKRDLFGHYTGKAKSFGNLSKKENPVNKRRRLKGVGGSSGNGTLTQPFVVSSSDDDQAKEGQ